MAAGVILGLYVAFGVAVTDSAEEFGYETGRAVSRVLGRGDIGPWTPPPWPGDFRRPIYEVCTEYVKAEYVSSSSLRALMDTASMSPERSCGCALNELQDRYTPEEFVDSVGGTPAKVIAVMIEGVQECVSPDR